MKNMYQRWVSGSAHWLLVRCWCLALLLGAGNLQAAGDSLVWHKEQERVDADIKSWELGRLLENVAGATGWQIYLEPNTTHDVSVKFKNLPTGDALRALLGDLSYVVVPRTNGNARLYVFRTTQRQATQLIHASVKKPAKPIPNELIVTLKPGSKVNIDELARSLGGKVIGRIDGQNAYRLQFDNEAATQAAREQLAANPDVASVDYNYPVDRPPSVNLSSGNSSPDLQLKPKDSSGNCQLVVGLVDTAVQPLGTNLDAFMLPKIQVAGNYQPDPSQLTHGTAMAETILGALQAKTGGSTSVKIRPVDVYGANESTSTFDVAQGIVQAVNNGANIINLSLGSSGDSQFLRNTIYQVTQQGIPVFAAAGNEPVTTPTYPAAYPGVVAVTASDSTGKIASYANRGSFIDMIAPGDNVVGYNGQSYLVEGTSTSTAFASGMAAGLADSAHACADQAETLLQNSVKPAAKPQ
jgi:hypothetical protein